MPRANLNNSNATHRWKCNDEFTKTSISKKVDHLDNCSTSDIILRYNVVVHKCKTYLKQCIQEEEVKKQLLRLVHSDRVMKHAYPDTLTKSRTRQKHELLGHSDDRIISETKIKDGTKDELTLLSPRNEHRELFSDNFSPRIFSNRRKRREAGFADSRKIPDTFDVTKCSNVVDMCRGWKELADLCDKEFVELRSYNIACGGVRPKRPKFTNSSNEERNDGDSNGFFKRAWIGFRDMLG